MPRASSLEAAIKKADPSVDVELDRGSGGVFDVFVDGKLVFSKHQEGRYPEPSEVIAALAS